MDWINGTMPRKKACTLQCKAGHSQLQPGQGMRFYEQKKRVQHSSGGGGRDEVMTIPPAAANQFAAFVTWDSLTTVHL